MASLVLYQHAISAPWEVVLSNYTAWRWSLCRMYDEGSQHQSPCFTPHNFSFFSFMLYIVQWLGVEQDQLPCGSTGTSSGNCQEIEICIVWACHIPPWPLKNHSSGHLGGWGTLWSVEEMLDGHHQRVDISVHARTAHDYGNLEEDLCWIVLPVPWQPNWSRNWTELNW